MPLKLRLTSLISNRVLPVPEQIFFQGRKKAERDSLAKAFGDLDWVCERKKALQHLLQILQLNIHTLWDPPVVEEEFVE